VLVILQLRFKFPSLYTRPPAQYRRLLKTQFRTFDGPCQRKVHREFVGVSGDPKGRGDSDISDRMSSIVFKIVRRDPLKNHVKIA
jgi:hypothetical protein